MRDQSRRVELEMLAILLAKPDLLDEYQITTDLFAEEEFGYLYLAIQKLHEVEERINRFNIQACLKNLMITVKKATIDLLFNTKVESSAKLAFETLTNLWKSREAKKVVNNISADLDIAKPEEVAGLLSDGVDKLETISQNETVEGVSFTELSEFFRAEVANPDLIEPGIMTGFHSIDATFNGFKEGNIGIVSAGTGVGKTTFALNMAYRMAAAGKSVGFLSLEMTKTELMDRLIGMHAGHSVKGVETRRVPDRVLRAIDKLKDFPLHIYELYERTVNNIAATLTAIKRKCGAAIIFIDYIGMILHPNGRSLHEDYAKIITKIKQVAQKLRIPIICLAQVTRESNKEGYSADSVQYSAGISSAAHQIIILKYLDDYDPETGTRQMQAKIVKNRGGRSFVDIPIEFQHSSQRMVEVDYPFEPLGGEIPVIPELDSNW